MGIWFSEEDLIGLGYKKGKDGNWSRSNVASYLPSRDSGEVSELKSNLPVRPARKNATKKKRETESEGCNFKIIVTSFRRRHCDPDNLCPKFYIDELVKQGVIPDDSSKYIASIEKRVVKTDERERTHIAVYKRV